MSSNTPTSISNTSSSNDTETRTADMMLVHTLPRHHYEALARFNPRDAVQLTEPDESAVFTYDELSKYDGKPNPE